LLFWERNLTKPDRMGIKTLNVENITYLLGCRLRIFIVYIFGTIVDSKIRSQAATLYGKWNF